MSRILIVTPSLARHDAVGNDVYAQQSLLRDAGYTTEIFAENTDAYYRDKVISREFVKDLIASRDTLLLYHHSFIWDLGEVLFNQAVCKIIFRYHNISPAKYFEYNADVMRDLIRGQRQTRRLLQSGKITAFINDSKFNSGDLVSFGADAKLMTEVAPFNKIHEFGEVEPDPRVRRQLDTPLLKLLFVSRVMPHKGQLNLIRIVDRYIDLYGPEIRLNLVGKVTAAPYLHEMIDFVNRRRLGSIVKFHTEVPFPALISFYRYSDVFMMTSEHEGFGVPILEAQFHKMPVLLLDRAAVRETAGPNQLVFPDLDLDRFCAALRVLHRDKEKSRHLGEVGYQNYLQYEAPVLRDKFLKEISKHF